MFHVIGVFKGTSLNHTAFKFGTVLIRFRTPTCLSKFEVLGGGGGGGEECNSKIDKENFKTFYLHKKIKMK